MENTLENNKLIAEFMGFELTDRVNLPAEYKNDDSPYSIIEFIDKVREADKLHPTSIQNMRFDTSWDWLMPVFDKIKDCIEPNAFEYKITGNWIEIRMNSQIGMALDYPFKAIEKDSGILEAHSAVIEFIEWYINFKTE